VIDKQVPCNGCRACCMNGVVPIGAHERGYLWHWHDRMGTEIRVLDQKPNGECVYLTETGCGIYGQRPETCRRFDCRDIILRMRARGTKTNMPMDDPVIKAGLERMDDNVSNGRKDDDGTHQGG
jgi:hypothetical protein